MSKEAKQTIKMMKEGKLLPLSDPTSNKVPYGLERITYHKGKVLRQSFIKEE